MSDKIPVTILGATGSVGQRFVELLSSHPWFEIEAITASHRSAGKLYGEAVNWKMGTPLPERVAKLTVQDCCHSPKTKLVFSGLDATVAGEIEWSFAEKGCLVISNSRNHRMHPHVPLLIPEVNPNHLELIHYQPFDSGAIITNPNCSVIPLSLALKPLEDRFGVEAIHVVTLQAVSGAGLRARQQLDIEDNVIPFISGEEEKIETEILKILGVYGEGKICHKNILISAQCNRVPVSDGHLQCVSVKLRKRPMPEEIIEAWETFSTDLNTPMAPEKPIRYFSEDRLPQPKHQRDLDRGMSVCIGRLRKCPIFDYKFVTLSHNTVRGAAGSAILNAELVYYPNKFKLIHQ